MNYKLLLYWNCDFDSNTKEIRRRIYYIHSPPVGFFLCRLRNHKKKAIVENPKSSKGIQVNSFLMNSKFYWLSHKILIVSLFRSRILLWDSLRCSRNSFRYDFLFTKNTSPYILTYTMRGVCWFTLSIQYTIQPIIQFLNFTSLEYVIKEMIESSAHAYTEHDMKNISLRKQTIWTPDNWASTVRRGATD